MTSTSSVITKRDADSQVLSPILDKLDDESLKRLEPFIAEIEEYIQQAVSSVPQNKLRRRSRKALISAAIYDTFFIGGTWSTSNGVCCFAERLSAVTVVGVTPYNCLTASVIIIK